MTLCGVGMYYFPRCFVAYGGANFWGEEVFSSILVQDLEVVCNTRKLFSVSYHPSLSEIL